MPLRSRRIQKHKNRKKLQISVSAGALPLCFRNSAAAVATEINKQFAGRIPDAAQLERNRQNLEQVRPKACLV
jgi:hypothetical protein